MKCAKHALHILRKLHVGVFLGSTFAAGSPNLRVQSMVSLGQALCNATSAVKLTPDALRGHPVMFHALMLVQTDIVSKGRAV